MKPEERAKRISEALRLAEEARQRGDRAAARHHQRYVERLGGGEPMHCWHCPDGAFRCSLPAGHVGPHNTELRREGPARTAKTVTGQIEEALDAIENGDCAEGVDSDTVKVEVRSAAIHLQRALRAAQEEAVEDGIDAAKEGE